MAPNRRPKQAKSASPPASTSTPSRSTTTATITATTGPETASDFITASELEPTSVPAPEPASQPVTVKPSKKRSKKDAPITTTPTYTVTPATPFPTTTTEATAPLAKKTHTYGRKSTSPTGKRGVRDIPPASNSTYGGSGSTSSESATSTMAAARLTPSPIRGWNNATLESMAAQSNSSGGKGRNSRGKSTTPPTLTATTGVMDTKTNPNATIAGNTDTATVTTAGTTNNGTNSPTPEFDPDATETDTSLIEINPNSGSDDTSRSRHNQTSRPHRLTRPPRTTCQQQVQIINNISNNFSHDRIGMVRVNHPPNTNPTAGAVSPSLDPALYSFPPHLWPSRFEDPSSRKRGSDGEELILPRMGTFSPTLHPTSDFSPSSPSSAVISVPFLSLPSSNLSSQPASKKARPNARTNTTTTTTTTTVPTAATGADQFSSRAGTSVSTTPTNEMGRGAASAAGTDSAWQTPTVRSTSNAPKRARRYRTGLAGGTAAQGNGHTVVTAASSNNITLGHGHDHGNVNGNNNGNGNAMEVDGGNNSGSNTDNNSRNSSNNILRHESGLVRRVGNRPIIAHSHTPRPGITPAEIGASLALELIGRREEAQRLRKEEETYKEEERRRNIEEVRRRPIQQAQQTAPSGIPTGQQESSSSSVPASPSTQYTLTSVQRTPPPRQNPQQYPRNQKLLGQPSASGGNPGQNPPYRLSQYHAPNYQPGNYTQHQQPLQHHRQSSYSSHHHLSSQQYQLSQHQQHLQHPQHTPHPRSQNHHQQFNVHQSSSYHGLTHPYSSFNHYRNYNGYHFNGNYYNGNHFNYNQQYSNYSNQNYHFNSHHRNQQYNSYNNYISYNNASSFSSTTGTTFFPQPSQPYGSSRPWQGSLRHGPYPHPSSRMHIPFPPQLPDTLLANAHSHRYRTSTSTSTNTSLQMLTSPAPQLPARPIVSRNPGSPTQHQFPEYDQMTRASQAEFAMLPFVRASAAQGPQVQACSNHDPTPVPVPVPSSHPSSSSGHLGNQQQQQQDSVSNGQSENHESDNDADDECSSRSA